MSVVDDGEEDIGGGPAAELRRTLEVEGRLFELEPRIFERKLDDVVLQLVQRRCVLHTSHADVVLHFVVVQILNHRTGDDATLRVSEEDVAIVEVRLLATTSLTAATASCTWVVSDANEHENWQDERETIVRPSTVSFAAKLSTFEEFSDKPWK